MMPLYALNRLVVSLLSNLHVSGIARVVSVCDDHRNAFDFLTWTRVRQRSMGTLVEELSEDFCTHLMECLVAVSFVEALAKSCIG